jgi:probable phosphoglycerate mutase
MESLLLVRHALAGSNRDRIASCAVPGEGLTAEGVEQARLLATRLADQEIALGVASELARTQETLELVLRGRAARRLVLGDLNEIGFGSFADGPLDECRAWAASRSPAELAPGGGEPRHCRARFAQGLRRLLERPETVVLHVGHALAVRLSDRRRPRPRPSASDGAGRARGRDPAASGGGSVRGCTPRGLEPFPSLPDPSI